MMLPELADFRQGARVLALSAMVNASDGDAKTGLADVAAICGMARHLRRDPMLISSLVARALQDIAARALEKVLAISSPARADLDALDLDSGASYRRVLQRALRMEEAMTVAFFGTLAEKDTGPMMERINGQLIEPSDAPLLLRLASPVLRVFLLESDLDDYRRIMEKCRRSAAYTYARGMNVWQKLDEIDEDQMRGVGVVTRMVAPVYSRARKSLAGGDAVVRLSTLAVAMAKHRAKTGQYPGSLAELGQDLIPAVPLDPFDGKPLRMKVQADAILLYSVGPDGKDDGGKREETPGQIAKDITIRLARGTVHAK
jgi:hypothetical protein